MEREFAQDELQKLEEKSRDVAGVSSERLQPEYAEFLRRARANHTKPDCTLALMLDERMRHIPMTSQQRIFHIVTALIVTKGSKFYEERSSPTIRSKRVASS